MNVCAERSLDSAPKSIVVPHKPQVWQRIVAWIVFLVERLVTVSLRCRWRDHSGLTDGQGEQPVIFCLWHNRLAISMMVHRRYPRKLAALVSASRDGALLAAVLTRFGVVQIRGSTSRRGPQALLELTNRARKGYDLAVTPDGPKGPRYVVQAGVIALAQLTGLPIVPVTCNTRRKLCLKSWDTSKSRFPSRHASSFSKNRSASPAKPMEPKEKSGAWNSKPACAKVPLIENDRRVLPLLMRLA
jgi:lysophospholipid acyltransferase (LPLAT)-like uncharacterized protein